MVIVGLHYFSLITPILFGNTILIIFRSITNFELVAQTYTKILVILGEICEITENPREIKCRFNLNRFVLKLSKFNRQFNDAHQFLVKIEPCSPFVNFCQLCIKPPPLVDVNFS